MRDAFYLPDASSFAAQPWTRGPWSVDHQHGGPPAALMARAMEREVGPAEEWQPTRFTLDFLKPIPIAILSVRTSLLRATRRLRVLQAVLEVDGAAVCQASCVFVRRADLPTPDTARSAHRLPGPEGLPGFTFSFFQSEVGYHTAMEARLPSGPWGGRACVAWMRMRVPLVAGETPSPLQRVLVAADASSGVAPPLDVTRFTFLNPELVLHLWRDLEGEWVGMDAASEAGPTGLGVARSTIYDADGACAASAQTLMIAAR